MRPVLIAAVIAVVALGVALLRGGSLDSLANTQFRWLVYLWVGLAIQVAYSFLPLDNLSKGRAVLVLLLSYVMVTAFFVANHRLPGMRIAVAGMALNIVVIAANGAMPVSLWAAEQIGAEDPNFDSGGIKHEAMTDDTVLGFLGDVIPIPGAGEVISIGDIVLAAGIAQLVYARATAKPKKRKGRSEVSAGDG